MNEEKFVQINGENWDLLQEISKIDNEAFGVDGITVFNLFQFAKAGGVFAFISNNEIVAEVILLRSFKDDKAVFLGFAVKKSFRCKGYGKKLLKHCLDFLQKEKIRCVELTVNPDDRVAMKMYSDRFGFRKICDLSDHPEKKQKRILLQKNLKENS